MVAARGRDADLELRHRTRIGGSAARDPSRAERTRRSVGSTSSTVTRRSKVAVLPAMRSRDDASAGGRDLDRRPVPAFDLEPRTRSATSAVASGASRSLSSRSAVPARGRSPPSITSSISGPSKAGSTMRSRVDQRLAELHQRCAWQNQRDQSSRRRADRAPRRAAPSGAARPATTSVHVPPPGRPPAGRCGRPRVSPASRRRARHLVALQIAHARVHHDARLCARALRARRGPPRTAPRAPRSKSRTSERSGGRRDDLRQHQPRQDWRVSREDVRFLQEEPCRILRARAAPRAAGGPSPPSVRAQACLTSLHVPVVRPARNTKRW